MNVELLRKIAEVIQEQPEHFQMEYLHTNNSGHAIPFESPKECGTAHCIAGWAAVLTKKDLANGSFGRKIRVSVAAEQRLIFNDQWPEPFKSRYLAAKLPQTRAKIAAERIEHFIATKGKE